MGTVEDPSAAVKRRKSEPLSTSRVPKKIHRTLVRPTSDKMQLANTFLDSAVKAKHNGQQMANCSEDATESAVDLDGNVAVAEDADGDAAEALDISLAQMNASPLKAKESSRAPGRIMGD